MSYGLSSESSNWILPSHSTTLMSTVPNYEEALPFRVNQEGVKNYMKNRGSLNIGDWAIEGQRMSNARANVSVDQEMYAGQPKVLGPDALRNYTKGRTTTPNLIYGNLQAPDPHHRMRVKREGMANYERGQSSQMKNLLENYGKLPPSMASVPHTQGEVNINVD
jgi:hypothetical protein